MYTVYIYVDTPPPSTRAQPMYPEEQVRNYFDSAILSGSFMQL